MTETQTKTIVLVQSLLLVVPKHKFLRKKLYLSEDIVEAGFSVVYFFDTDDWMQ